MSTAGSIVIDLLMKTGSFETDTKRAEKRMKEVTQTVKNMGLAFGAAGLAAGASLAYLVKNQITTMDSMSKMAQQAGVTTEVLSSLGYAAEMSGSSNEEMASTLAKLNKAMFDAANGTGEAKSALDAMGLSVLDSNGALKGADQMFTDIADNLSKMQDETQKSALAQRVFGEEGKKLIPLLNSGKDGIEAMRKEAQRLGIVIDSDAAKAAESFNDNLTRLQKVGEGWVNQLATEAVPILSDLTMRMFEASTETDIAGGAADDLTKKKVAPWARTATLSIAGLADIVATTTTGLASLGSALDALTAGSVLRYQQAIHSLGNLTTDLFEVFTPEETTRELRMNLEKDMTEALNNAWAARREFDKNIEGHRFGYYSDMARMSLDAIDAGEGSGLPSTPPRKLPTRAITDLGKPGGVLSDGNAAQEYQRFIDDITGRADAARKAQEEAWLYHALAVGEITSTEFSDAMNTFTERTSETLEGFWPNYLKGAEEALTSFDDLALEVSNNFTRGFGNAFEAMIFDSKNMGDAIGNFAMGMSRSFANAVGEMISQWLLFQAISGIGGGLFGGLFGSGATALGPGSTLGGAGAVAFPIGMAHDGIHMIPQTGTWLLEKGERVMTADTSSRLDGLLERIERGRTVPRDERKPGAPNVSVVINNAPPGTTAEVSQVSDEEFVVNIMTAQVMSNGRFHAGRDPSPRMEEARHMSKQPPLHDYIDAAVRHAFKEFRKQAQHSGMSRAELAVLDAKLSNFRVKSVKALESRMGAVLREVEVEMIQAFEEEFGKMTRH